MLHRANACALSALRKACNALREPLTVMGDDGYTSVL